MCSKLRLFYYSLRVSTTMSTLGMRLISRCEIKRKFWWRFRLSRCFLVSVLVFFYFLRYVKKNISGNFDYKNDDYLMFVTTQDGRTALHHAVEHGVANSDLQMARLLLSYGADANIRDEVRYFRVLT